MTVMTVIGGATIRMVLTRKAEVIGGAAIRMVPHPASRGDGSSSSSSSSSTMGNNNGGRSGQVVVAVEVAVLNLAVTKVLHEVAEREMELEATVMAEAAVAALSRLYWIWTVMAWN